MKADDIKAWDARARAHFSYRLEAKDNWRSFASAVMANEAWKGDCDDLAFTTLTLLVKGGADKNKLWRACVSSTGGKHIDHMVAIAEDSDGLLWLVGDTFGPAYPAGRCKHRLIMTSRVSEGIMWREARFLNRDGKTVIAV